MTCHLFLCSSEGWWFDACGPSNLNGMYYTSGQNSGKLDGIKWHYFKGPNYSLRATTMMIRPLNFWEIYHLSPLNLRFLQVFSHNEWAYMLCSRLNILTTSVWKMKGQNDISFLVLTFRHFLHCVLYVSIVRWNSPLRTWHISVINFQQMY